MAEALRRYDAVSQRLGEEFKAELRRVIAVAAAKPGRFHVIKPGSIVRISNASRTTLFTAN